MRVIASLQFSKRKPDGSEEKIPLPDNYPDAVEMEVQSLDQVGEVAAAAFKADLKEHGIPIPTDIVVNFTAKVIDYPSRN